MVVDRSVFALHVFPEDLARGAQRRARAVSIQLDRHDLPHRTMSLFATSDPAGLADYRLDVRRTPLSALFEPHALVRLRRRLKELNPTFVIAYGSESLRYCIATAPGGQQVIYSKIGHVTGRVRGARLAFHRFLVARSAAVAAVSTDAAEEVRTLVGAHNVVVVSNGRDPERFKPREDLRFEADRIRLLWVGHLTDGKRPELFVRLVERLRAGGLDVDARLVGSGPRSEKLRQRASLAGVEMLGQRQDIPELMRHSDILVFTSNGESEGLPGVLIEAGLSGLPVVATDVPGVRDVIVDGETGFCCDPDDEIALATALVRLVEQAVKRTTMGRAARSRCVNQFTIEASAARWRTMFAELQPGST